MISIAYRADCESGQKIKNLSEVHLFITPWNSEAKFVKKTFLISKWLGLGLGFEIKKVFEQIYSIGRGKSVPFKMWVE